MTVASGEATGLGAPRPVSEEELSEEWLLGKALGGASWGTPAPLVLYWEHLWRFELLPCWSAAGWRPPASCGGYRMPWVLEPPSWVGGCPNNWVVTTSEA